MNDSSRRRARDSASEAARFLRFSSRYHDDIAAGRKRATTRFQDPVRLGPTIFVFEDEDEASRRLLGHIDSVESHRFDALSDDIARLENCSTADELRDAVRGHYPGIVDDAIVEVVRFRLEDADTDA